MQGSSGRHDFLLQQLRSGADGVLRRLLRALSHAVSELGRAPAMFDELTALALGARLRPLHPAGAAAPASDLAGCITTPETAEAYSGFISALVGANSVFLVSALRALVRNLVLMATDLHAAAAAGTLADAAVAPAIVTQFHATVYVTLADTVRLVPTGTTSLYSVLAEHFPHKRMPHTLHKWYTRHLLCVAALLPQLADRIMATIMDRMVDLDVEISLDDLPDEDEVSAADSGNKPALTQAQVEAVDHANKLDDMCLLVLRFVHARMCGCDGEADVGDSAHQADDGVTPVHDALHTSAQHTANFRDVLLAGIRQIDQQLSADAGCRCKYVAGVLRDMRAEEEETDVAPVEASPRAACSPSISPLAATAQALNIKGSPSPMALAVSSTARAGAAARPASSLSQASHSTGSAAAPQDDYDDGGMHADGVVAMTAMGSSLRHEGMLPSPKRAIRGALFSATADAGRDVGSSGVSLGPQASASLRDTAPVASNGAVSTSSSSAGSSFTVRTASTGDPAPADHPPMNGLSDTPSRPMPRVIGGHVPAASLGNPGAALRETSDVSMASAEAFGVASASGRAYTAPVARTQSGIHRRDHMFALMLGVFERSVLLTSRSKYCQFAMFYTCALDESFTERFVARLLHQLRNRERPALTRATCAAYLGSFMARAAFVDDTVMRSALVHLLTFARTYAQLYYAHSMRRTQLAQAFSSNADAVSLERFQASLPPLPPLPAPSIFYATMQAIMYVLCFHAAALRERAGGLEFLRSLAVGDLLACELDPLAHTLETVAREFVRVAHALQLVAHGDMVHSSAYARLTRPARAEAEADAMSVSSAEGAGAPNLAVDGAARDEDAVTARRRAEIAAIVAASGGADLSETATAVQSVVNPVEAFFPFDPFLLRDSSKYISPIFREWNSSSLPEDEVGTDWMDADAAEAPGSAHAHMKRRKSSGEHESRADSQPVGAGRRRPSSAAESATASSATSTAGDDTERSSRMDDDSDDSEIEDAGESDDADDSSSDESASSSSLSSDDDDELAVRPGDVLMQPPMISVSARMRKSLGLGLGSDAGLLGSDSPSGSLLGGATRRSLHATAAARSAAGLLRSISAAQRATSLNDDAEGGEDAILAGLDIDISGAPLAQGYAPESSPLHSNSTGSDADQSSHDWEGRGRSGSRHEWAGGPGTSPMFSAGLGVGGVVPAFSLDGKPISRRPGPRGRSSSRGAGRHGLSPGITRNKMRGVSFDESTYYASIAAAEQEMSIEDQQESDAGMPTLGNSFSGPAPSAAPLTATFRTTHTLPLPDPTAPRIHTAVPSMEQLAVLLGGAAQPAAVSHAPSNTSRSLSDAGAQLAQPREAQRPDGQPGSATKHKIVRARRNNSADVNGRAAAAARRDSELSEISNGSTPRAGGAKRPRDPSESPHAVAGYSSSTTDASPVAGPASPASSSSLDANAIAQLYTTRTASTAGLPPLHPAVTVGAPVYNFTLAAAGGQALPPALLATLRSTAPPTASTVGLAAAAADASTAVQRSYAAVASSVPANSLLPHAVGLVTEIGGAQLGAASSFAAPTLLGQLASSSAHAARIGHLASQSLIVHPAISTTGAAAPAYSPASPALNSVVPPWDIFTNLMHAEADKLQRSRTGDTPTPPEPAGAQAGIASTDGSDRDDGDAPGNLVTPADALAAADAGMGRRSAAAATLEDALLATKSPSGKSKPKVHASAAPRERDGKSVRKRERRGE